MHVIWINGSDIAVFHSGHIRVKQNSFYMRVMQRQNQNLWGETSMQRHHTDKKYSEKTIVSFYGFVFVFNYENFCTADGCQAWRITELSKPRKSANWNRSHINDKHILTWIINTLRQNAVSVLGGALCYWNTSHHTLKSSFERFLLSGEMKAKFCKSQF